MATLSAVYLRKNGVWGPIPNPSTPVFYGRFHTTWRAVTSIYAYRLVSVGKYDWQLLYQRSQNPARNLRGTNTASNTVNSATLTWDAPLNVPTGTSIEYKVLQYDDGGSTPTASWPTPAQSPTGWTSSRTQVVSNLELGKTYNFRVLARAQTGLKIETLSDEVIWLKTGSQAVLHQSPAGGKVVVVSPTGTGTWSADKKWNETTDGKVVQGYDTQKVRNGHGAVKYGNLASQVRTAINAGGFDHASHATVTKARIVQVYRPNNPSSSSPSVNCYACDINFNSNVEPVHAPGYPQAATFQAPATGEMKSNFPIVDKGTSSDSSDDVDRLVNWSQHWLTAATKVHNGILIFRDDGGGNDTIGHNGYCIFRNADVIRDDWKLELTLTWNYNDPAATLAVWQK